MGADCAVAALLAALLAMNMAWLLGFSSFLLGACAFPITLGIWWPGRNRPVRLASRRCPPCWRVGYFCHVVSLGLTVLGLVVLSLTDALPNVAGGFWRCRLARLARTSLSFIPLVVLGFFYVGIARRGGPMHPVWNNLSNPWSPLAWGARLGWADPLTLAIKDGLPFTDRTGSEFIVFAPTVWFCGALIFWWYGRMTAGSGTTARRPAAGAVNQEGSASAGGGGNASRPARLDHPRRPPDCGRSARSRLTRRCHGEFLPQRVILLGLVALVPIFDINPARWPGRAAATALAVAVILQSAVVWDYARYSDRTAGQIIRASNLVGRDQRIVTLLVTSSGRFRANPLLHAENWLGVDTRNVVWNNYETLHYYFPVQFLPGIARPHPGDLELVSLHEDPDDKPKRLRDWEQILSQHADSIDAVLVWKRDEELEELTKCWFDRVERRGDVQVFHRSGSLSRK